MGYAPDGWQPLAQVFQPYPNNALTECGQVIHNEEQNRYYDRFRHRIMFPIRDQQGRVIGFGGRVLDDSKPKYLNSPDTPLFDKGRNLYGLYEARNAVRDAGRILVVEGYMDVVALAQFGIPYAVASLGTSTTGEHIKILMRQSDEIYFASTAMPQAGKPPGARLKTPCRSSKTANPSISSSCRPNTTPTATSAPTAKRNSKTHSSIRANPCPNISGRHFQTASTWRRRKANRAC